MPFVNVSAVVGVSTVEANAPEANTFTGVIACLLFARSPFSSLAVMVTEIISPGAYTALSVETVSVGAHGESVHGLGTPEDLDDFMSKKTVYEFLSSVQSNLLKKFS